MGLHSITCIPSSVSVRKCPLIISLTSPSLLAKERERDCARNIRQWLMTLPGPLIPPTGISRFWWGRKPENPKRTAEIKLRSSETQPTCNICKRGGDNHLPLAGSTRSAARQVTVKRRGISALTYSYDNCGFWYRMVSPSQSFSGSHTTFPQSRYWEKLDKLLSSLQRASSAR